MQNHVVSEPVTQLTLAHDAGLFAEGSSKKSETRRGLLVFAGQAANPAARRRRTRREGEEGRARAARPTPPCSCPAPAWSVRSRASRA